MSITSKGLGKTLMTAMALRQVEQEKLKLTRELHDTVLQEQIIVLRELDMIISEKEMLQHRELKQRLLRVREQQASSIYMLRDFCQMHYAPQLAADDWYSHIQLLLDRMQLRSRIEVVYHNNWRKGLDGEKALHTYRIIQELLYNTEKHACATKIELIMEQENDSYVLEYRDNGVGIEDVDQAIKSSLGLRGICSRVECLQGSIQFTSGRQAGFQCTLRVSKTVCADDQPYSLIH